MSESIFLVHQKKKVQLIELQVECKNSVLGYDHAWETNHS